jgi:hypothetical protein
LDDHENVFFFRQRVSQDGTTLEPELAPMCVCAVVWSPLDTRQTEECPSCHAIFHLECMRQHLDLKCVECKEALPRSLIYTHLREARGDVRDEAGAPSQKRARLDDEEDFAQL